MKDLILAIDQGTSGSKAVIFNREGSVLCDGRAPLESLYPREGFVEQDPEAIYASAIAAVGNSLKELASQGRDTGEIACCGISNQRETFLLWDETGKPLGNAVVWQCKRSIGICEELKSAGDEPFLRSKTGLFVDPYFSGTKLIWLMKNEPEVRKAVEEGRAYFGNVDTWLLYKLTGGKEYKTDYTNASRTLFFNLKDLVWDREILDRYGLSRLNFPEVFPSGADYGVSDFEGLFGESVPITGMLGDSHAAAFGERCLKPGSAKATLGTGSSVLLNTGEMVDPDKTDLAVTVCWSLEGRVSYALEGIIVSCASTMTWLSDRLNLFGGGKEADRIAEDLEDNGGVYLIPAFSGLGAPWWKMDQKAQIVGLTFDSGREQIVRAGLESIAYQVTDVVGAMGRDMGKSMETLQIDGGISSSPFVSGLIADLNGTRIIRNRQKEASAQGAAFAAGLQKGLYRSLDDIEKLQFEEEIISPAQRSDAAESYAEWRHILERLD